MTDPVRRLLDQKIQEATKEMSRRLEQELFYGSSPKSEWKGIGGMGERLTVDDVKGLMEDAVNRGSEPDRFVVSPSTYKQFEESIKPFARFTDLGTADQGFENLMHRGVPVTYDNTVPSGVVYGVNMNSTNYWGGRPISASRTTNQWNQIPISDEILRDVTTSYKKTITDNVFRESPLMEATKKKGKKMTVVKDLRAEINHEKEVKRVTKALKKFEGSWLYKLKEGAHIGFDVTFEEGGTAYAYAGIFDGKCWHLTGARSPQKISTDDLVDWLIEHNVKFKDVKLYKPVSK